MSTILIHKQFTSMKRRFGWSDPPRRKLIDRRMHTCPGNILHAKTIGLTPMRKMKLFDRHHPQSHKAYVTYWRCHMDDYRRYMKL